LIERGALRALVTLPQRPRIGYAALFRSDRQFGLNQNVAQLAVSNCDFPRLLL
jgi:hypothetical protein